MNTISNPKVVTTLSRFSSAFGYGYRTVSKLVDNGNETVIASKILHCAYGNENWLAPYETSISPEALNSIQHFCEKNGDFWGAKVSKEIDFNKAWELREAFK